VAILALLLRDAVAAARLTSAVDRRHRVVHAPSWRQLLRLVMQHPVDLAIVDVYDPFRPVSFQQLQRLRSKHADLAILVYSDFVGRESDLFDLGRLRVDGVLQVTGRERRTEIYSATEKALARAAAARVMRRLEGRLPTFAVDCLGWAVEHAEEKPRVGDLAEAVGASTRALGRDLRSQDLPSPNQLLVWGRLLQAARLLQEPGATVDEVAYRIGYSTGGALRRAIKRGTGLVPRELVRRGGLAPALDRFVAELTGMAPQATAASRPRKHHWATRGR